MRHKDQELVAMKQKNSRLIKESTKEGKSRVKVPGKHSSTKIVYFVIKNEEIRPRKVNKQNIMYARRQYNIPYCTSRDRPQKQKK